MAESVLYLDELYPVELFKVLTPAAQIAKGQYLKEARIIIPQHSIFGTLVTLAIPSPHGGDLSNPLRTKVFEAAVAAYREVKDREPGQKSDGQPVPLLHGLARLLLLAPPGDEGAQPPAVVHSDEYLVVAPQMTKEQVTALFTRLSLHATHTRAAGVKAGKGSRYFFYVKDDHQRRSSFLSLAAGEALGGSRLLQAFPVGEFIFFFPHDAAPGTVELDHFCRFLQAGPYLLGKEKLEKGLVAAVCRWPRTQTRDNTIVEFLYLGGLTFYGQSTFTRPAPDALQFRYVDLSQTPVSLETLKTDLQAVAPQTGYRLELRSTRYLESTKVDRLYEEKARVEYQLAYLESVSQPRPVLYRFTQRQLPALADVLRNFSMKVLHNGSLKYGFQATPHEPAGCHYILVEPGDAAMSGLDPLPLWEDLDTPPMRFRLDPSWARYYHDQSGACLVFVPEGCSLFPAMHDWDRRSMDRYLRETLQQWFEGQSQTQSIPEYPIYIYDGSPQPGSPIRISVLDLESFKPLHTRLGWLNDNLTVLNTVGIEEFITKMSMDITWQQLYRQLMKDADQIQKDFETAAVDSARKMAGILHEMTSSLTDEINRAVESTFQMISQVKKLDQQLKQWENVCAGMKRVLADVDKTKEQAIQETVKTNSEFYTMVTQIDHEINTTQKKREEIQNKIAAEMEQLKTSYKTIKKKLFSLKK